MPADQHEACLIERVVLRNYKSIEACDVRLGPLTFLVGANGSGKSNFLDALRFVSDALRNGLDYALRDRGGADAVRRRGHRGRDFGMRVDFHLPGGAQGHFAFEIAGGTKGIYVPIEECFVSGPGIDENYIVMGGEVIRSTLPLAPRGVRDRLYLVNASGAPAFKPVFDALSTMSFYNLNPDRIRDFLPPDPGAYLTHDGANLPSILAKLTSESRDQKSRIEAYLEQVVPGIVGVHPLTIGGRETIEFKQRAGATHERFTADSMSDGTLRALGILVGLFQGSSDRSGPSLIGMEEPESGLHPAATEVLVDAFREAAEFRQVLVTSHSPDLLDNESIADSEILAVVSEDGRTSLGPLDQTGRSVLRDHLYTAGQLLRMHQLRPSAEAFGLDADGVDLFGVRESTDR
jgi:predicted ATPase